MNRMALGLLIGITLGVGCSGGEDLVEPPVPGTLTVNLVTPHADDGALLLSVQGPVAPTAITAGAGLRLFMGSTAPTSSTAVVVVGPIANGTLLRVSVPNIRQASEFTASVRQGASSSLEVRSPADYSVSVSQ
jgi:hypothetical protein